MGQLIAVELLSLIIVTGYHKDRPNDRHPRSTRLPQMIPTSRAVISVMLPPLASPASIYRQYMQRKISRKKTLLHLYADYHQLLCYCINIITSVMKEIGKQHFRLVPKSHRPTRRNKTVEFRRVGVRCVNWNLGGCK